MDFIHLHVFTNVSNIMMWLIITLFTTNSSYSGDWLDRLENVVSVTPIKYKFNVVYI